jgi:hypothetical protein
MNRTLALAGILLALFVGLPLATSADRTRGIWLEGCQERQVHMLDKCQLGYAEQTLPD